MADSSAGGLGCQVEAHLLSACYGSANYEHDDKRYCILHLPIDNKEDDFKKAVQSKLKAEDFNFLGVYFPSGFDALSGATLSGNADFRNATFGKGANFYNATFSKLAYFIGATFSEGANFTGATFSEGANFTGATFSWRADFRKATFSSGAGFLAANFSDEADFSEATFSEEADFRKVVFSKGAAFSGATFGKKAYFSRATFNGKAEFHQATFGEVTFSSAIFKQEARYVSAEFKKYSTFDNATFEQIANFYCAIFKGKVEFAYATFKEVASFHETQFGEASFSWVTFAEAADFSRALFRGDVGFFRATFEAQALFTGETQEAFDVQKAVDFRATTIDKPERFSLYSLKLRPSWFVNADAVRKLNFTDVEWYGMPGGPPGTIKEEIKQLCQRRGSDNRGSDLHELLAKTYRELSANAEENRDYPRANEFHYKSMETLRKRRHSRQFDLILSLYRLLSGYGDKVGKAFVVLVAIWLVFAVAYLTMAPSSYFLPSSFSNPEQLLLKRCGQVAVYSLAALFRLSPEPKPPGPGWFQALVTAEGIIGPLQVALFLLAVRRKVMR